MEKIVRLWTHLVKLGNQIICYDSQYNYRFRIHYNRELFRACFGILVFFGITYIIKGRVESENRKSILKRLDMIFYIMYITFGLFANSFITSPRKTMALDFVAIFLFQVGFVVQTMVEESIGVSTMLIVYVLLCHNLYVHPLCKAVSTGMMLLYSGIFVRRRIHGDQKGEILYIITVIMCLVLYKTHQTSKERNLRISYFSDSTHSAISYALEYGSRKLPMYYFEKFLLSIPYKSLETQYAPVMFIRFKTSRADNRVPLARFQQFVELVDKIATNFGIEKIKTVNFDYLVTAGLVFDRSQRSHRTNSELGEIIKQMFLFVLTITKFVKRFDEMGSVAVGLAFGPIFYGIIGIQTLAFDVWGTTVNHASRLMARAMPFEIYASQSVQNILPPEVTSFRKLPIELKGIKEKACIVIPIKRIDIQLECEECLKGPMRSIGDIEGYEYAKNILREKKLLSNESSTHLFPGSKYCGITIREYLNTKLNHSMLKNSFFNKNEVAHFRRQWDLSFKKRVGSEEMTNSTNTLKPKESLFKRLLSRKPANTPGQEGSGQQTTGAGSANDTLSSAFESSTALAKKLKIWSADRIIEGKASDDLRSGMSRRKTSNGGDLSDIGDIQSFVEEYQDFNSSKDNTIVESGTTTLVAMADDALIQTTGTSSDKKQQQIDDCGIPTPTFNKRRGSIDGLLESVGMTLKSIDGPLSSPMEMEKGCSRSQADTPYECEVSSIAQLFKGVNIDEQLKQHKRHKRELNVNNIFYLIREKSIINSKQKYSPYVFNIMVHNPNLGQMINIIKSFIFFIVDNTIASNKWIKNPLKELTNSTRRLTNDDSIGLIFLHQAKRYNTKLKTEIPTFIEKSLTPQTKCIYRRLITCLKDLVVHEQNKEEGESQVSKVATLDSLHRYKISMRFVFEVMFSYDVGFFLQSLPSNLLMKCSMALLSIFFIFHFAEEIVSDWTYFISVLFYPLVSLCYLATSFIYRKESKHFIRLMNFTRMCVVYIMIYVVKIVITCLSHMILRRLINKVNSPNLEADGSVSTELFFLYIFYFQMFIFSVGKMMNNKELHSSIPTVAGLNLIQSVATAIGAIRRNFFSGIDVLILLNPLIINFILILIDFIHFWLTNGMTYIESYYSINLAKLLVAFIPERILLNVFNYVIPDRIKEPYCHVELPWMKQLIGVCSTGVHKIDRKLRQEAMKIPNWIGGLIEKKHERFTNKYVRKGNRSYERHSRRQSEWVEADDLNGPPSCIDMMQVVDGVADRCESVKRVTKHTHGSERMWPNGTKHDTASPKSSIEHKSERKVTGHFLMPNEVILFGSGRAISQQYYISLDNLTFRTRDQFSSTDHQPAIEDPAALRIDAKMCPDGHGLGWKPVRAFYALMWLYKYRLNKKLKHRIWHLKSTNETSRVNRNNPISRSTENYFVHHTGPLPTFIQDMAPFNSESVVANVLRAVDEKCASERTRCKYRPRTGMSDGRYTNSTPKLHLASTVSTNHHHQQTRQPTSEETSNYEQRFEQLCAGQSPIDILEEITEKEKMKCEMSLMPFESMKKTTESGNFTEMYPFSACIFLDVAGFTSFCSKTSLNKILKILTYIFTLFDTICNKYPNTTKIKTLGDGYQVIVGTPFPQCKASLSEAICVTKAAAKMTLEMIEEAKSAFERMGYNELAVSAGMGVGYAFCDTIGYSRYSREAFGDAVDEAKYLVDIAGKHKLIVGCEAYALLQCTGEFDLGDQLLFFNMKTVTGKWKSYNIVLYHNEVAQTCRNEKCCKKDKCSHVEQSCDETSTVKAAWIVENTEKAVVRSPGESEYLDRLQIAIRERFVDDK